MVIQSAFECFGNLISSYSKLKYISSNLHPLSLFCLLAFIIEKLSPEISWGINSKLLRKGDARKGIVLAPPNIIKVIPSTTTFSNPKECATWPIIQIVFMSHKRQRWKVWIVIDWDISIKDNLFIEIEWVCYTGFNILGKTL